MHHRADSTWTPPSASILIVAEAPSGRILFSSAPAPSLVGRSLAELEDDIQLLRPDGKPVAPSAWPLARSIAGGEVVVEEEYVYVGAGGRRCRVRCSCTPIRDVRGQRVAAAGMFHDVTSLEQLEQERADHASLLDNLEDAVVGTDPEFRLTVWNRGAERLYGFRAEEVLGHPAREVASYAGDESRLQLERELLTSDRTRIEITAVRKDGTHVQVELISVALRDERGEITGSLGIHRDISERKQAEEELRASRKRAQDILESIGDAFFAVDRDWRYTYINERAMERARVVLGRDVGREEVLGRTIWELFPAVVGTPIDHELRRGLEERTNVAFEARSTHGDAWLDIHAYGSDEGLSVYSRDITEQKRTEGERDRRNREQALVAELGQRALESASLQAVLDAACEVVAEALAMSPVGIAEVIADGRPAFRLRAGVGWEEGAVGTGWGGPGTTSLVGYTSMSGRPVVSADLAADERFELSPFLRSYAAESAAAVAIAGRGEPFGVLVALSRSTRPIAVEEVNFLQAIAHVVSAAVERFGAEARVAEVREAERRRIGRDLHDEALQDLTAALASAAEIDMAGAAPEVAQRVDDIARSVRRGAQQVRGAIYDLRLGVDEDLPFDVRLRELVEVHRALAPALDIELEISGPLAATSLGGRSTEVLRVVGEALTNARRHSGATAILVAARRVGDRLCVEIADGGGGFDVSAPLGSAQTGLRGMRERAEQLGAELLIDSAPGDGTSVRVTADLGPGRRNGGRAERVRILLVEDHVSVREAIAATLAREPGFEIVGQAASLAEARPLLGGSDIMVVDLGLPDGYGGDLIRELRVVNPRAHALVLTANMERAEVARAVARGAAAAFDKTAGLHDVVDAVRRLRAGETLLPVTEVVDLLRFEVERSEREREDRETLARLTPREREVLQTLADGLSTKEAADQLHITLRTQRNHIANILLKLGVHTQLQAVVLALRYGVVDVS